MAPKFLMSSASPSESPKLGLCKALLSSQSPAFIVHHVEGADSPRHIGRLMP